MKTTNIINGLKDAGFYDVSCNGNIVKVNIGFMAKKDWQQGFASEYARFEDLKFKVMQWASLHGLIGKREGGAFLLYGE